MSSTTAKVCLYLSLLQCMLYSQLISPILIHTHPINIILCHDMSAKVDVNTAMLLAAVSGEPGSNPAKDRNDVPEF
jgi:hypothetical protein